MKRTSMRTAIVLSLGLAVSGTSTSASPVHVVVGQDNAAVDRAAIQSAIDDAAPGDVIELRGLFQLDGTSILVQKSRLTLAGQALDNDGDGATNEDWADGVDNDGDGSTDEDDWDAILQGVDDGSGGPVGDNFPDRFNDGIEILGFDARLGKITIRDLRFTRLNRSVYLFPDYDDDGSVLLCGSATPTGGSLEDVRIHGNGFDNGFRGVELLGRVDRLRIEENVFRGIRNQSVVMFGDTIGCAEPDGSIETFLPLGTPSKTRVSSNRFEGGGIGVLSFVSKMTSVACNVMNGQNLGVISVEDGKLKASRNAIDGNFIGFLGTVDPRVEGSASKNSFRDNVVSNTVFGVIVDCDTTGYTISGNAFSDSAFVDVLLDGTNDGFCGGDLGDSFENIAIVDSASSVIDAGRDNVVIVDDDSDSDSNSDCDSDSD